MNPVCRRTRKFEPTPITWERSSFYVLQASVFLREKCSGSKKLKGSTHHICCGSITALRSIQGFLYPPEIGQGGFTIRVQFEIVVQMHARKNLPHHI